MISQHITCQGEGDYLVFCRKSSGPCAALFPTYVGITEEGENNSFTHRLGRHLGSGTNPCQVDMTKPIGRHFRLLGHDAQRDMVMLPFEPIRRSDILLRKAGERFNILKFETENKKSVTELEHCLNLDPGH